MSLNLSHLSRKQTPLVIIGVSVGVIILALVSTLYGRFLKTQVVPATVQQYTKAGELKTDVLDAATYALEFNAYDAQGGVASTIASTTFEVTDVASPTTTPTVTPTPTDTFDVVGTIKSVTQNHLDARPDGRIFYLETFRQLSGPSLALTPNSKGLVRIVVNPAQNQPVDQALGRILPYPTPNPSRGTCMGFVSISKYSNGANHTLARALEAKVVTGCESPTPSPISSPSL